VTSKDIIHDLTSILEEASPHCQEVIERAIKEIEERDSEITHLKTELKKKDVVIEEQDQYFDSFFRFCVETFNAAAEALEIVCPGRETRQFLAGTKTAVETATPEGRPFAVVGRIRQIIERMKETPPISHVDGNRPDPLRYDVKTLNQKRAEAIAAHVQQTGKTSIKSVEARAVLETVEHRRLDRKTVCRALRAAQGILRATADKMGGVTRLIIPGSPSQKRTLDVSDGRHDSGGGDERSRLRRRISLGSG